MPNLANHSLHRLSSKRPRPYYIDPPPYARTSSGIRVLHLLCHALNSVGMEAYVYTDVTAPNLRTPTLTPAIMEGHRQAGLEPIVVYPEVVFGNPRKAKSVVRYLLNRPGLINGPKTFPPGDMLVTYGKTLVPEDWEHIVLHLPCYDLSLFNNDNNPDDPQRQGALLYLGRHQKGLEERPDLAEKCTLITKAWPASHEDMAELFRKSEVIYSFEASAIITEAILCGCPAVLLKSPFCNGTTNAMDEIGRWGIAFEETEEELAFARNTAPKLREVIEQAEGRFWEDLQTFIAKSQELAIQTVETDALADMGDNVAYQLWRQRTTLQDIDGQLLGERMVRQWKTQPFFNVMLQVQRGEENLLADSIDSLATQWYPHWHLTVLTDFPPADPSLTESGQITWIAFDPDEPHKPFLDGYLPDAPGDWLLHLQVGTTLETHTLTFFADSINLAPGAAGFYCDEDQKNAAGEFINPYFRPQANLELLRSIYYLGTCTAIHKQTLLDAGGWSAHPQAAPYDHALKLVAHRGINALAHIPHVLAHGNAEQQPAPDEAQEQALVREHLLRMGVSAKVGAGHLQGSQKVLYVPQEEPLVSIVIPSRNQPGYLAHCIDSLLRETAYRAFELVVVDHGTTDPDALDYLASLANHPQLGAARLQVIRDEGPFNYARLCNRGAELARGHYVLFLDNDTECIQPDWLHVLVGYAQQPDVAGVGLRLASPDKQTPRFDQGPLILGLDGLVGNEASGTDLLSPGHHGHRQVAQDVSALAGTCLLVNKACFEAVGRFDEVNTPIYRASLDLSLRLRKAGYRLIWTPWADLVHQGSKTIGRLEGNIETAFDLSKQKQLERDHLLRTALPAFADDPYYNRHLSFVSANIPDPHLIADWDKRTHDRLRVLGLPLTSGQGEFRMTAPFRALQKAGLAQCSIVHPVDGRSLRVLSPLEIARAAPDVFMPQQGMDDRTIFNLKETRKYLPDLFVTYAIDDAIGNVPTKHPSYNFLIREGKFRMREALSYCHRVIASTQPIADYCAGMVDDIVVVPNRLESSQWLGHQSLRRVGKKPRVGWAGAQQHLGDLSLIQEVVETLKDEVEWVFMGMCPDFLKPHVTEEHDFVRITEYPAKLATLNLDLAIAPLEQHVFNECKSNLRILEYGIMGWPVVCTDIYPYQTNKAPVKRVPNVAQAWIDAIRERINDLDAAEKEGDALKAWVRKHYILEDHVHEWLAAVTPPQKRE